MLTLTLTTTPDPSPDPNLRAYQAGVEEDHLDLRVRELLGGIRVGLGFGLRVWAWGLGLGFKLSFWVWA